MHRRYTDIIYRLGPPRWWDAFGFPRYCRFTPGMASNVYAIEAVLLLIACQECDEQFQVCMALSRIQMLRNRPSLADQVRDGMIHYGTPPNSGCCAAGPTMRCLDLRVLEYWHRVDHEWQRDPDLETELPDNRRS